MHSECKSTEISIRKFSDNSFSDRSSTEDCMTRPDVSTSTKPRKSTPAPAVAELYAQLAKIEWISEDPVIRSQLREIVLKWVNVADLLTTGGPVHVMPSVTNGCMPTHDMIAADCGAPATACSSRQRSWSEDSIVEPKQDKAIADVSPAPSPNDEPVSTEWECRKCTFMNSVDATTSCLICGWFKARSSDATEGANKKRKKDSPVEEFITSRVGGGSPRKPVSKQEDAFSEILSRSVAGAKEHRLTGISTSSSSPADCTLFVSRFNLLACGQAQENATWMQSVEKDVSAQHNLDEELLFSKRWMAAKQLVVALESAKKLADSAKAANAQLLGDGEVADPAKRPDVTAEDPAEAAVMDAAAIAESKREYAVSCNSILGTSFVNMQYAPIPHTLTWDDWCASGVHTGEYLKRLLVIHAELTRECISHYSPVLRRALTAFDVKFMENELHGRELIAALMSEPQCDLDLHCLSHVEGDNVMDRFLIPASMERANLIYSALTNVWMAEGKTAFVAARPPGHHCPSFEDRLIGLTANSSTSPVTQEAGAVGRMTPLEKRLCAATGLSHPPREHGMGFCSLNGLAVAVKRFLQVNNADFERIHGRSIRVAILDLDIHAGNGTELVFRDNRSVLHVSFHRYGWLKANTPDGDISERVMPGTHYYRDVGGIFGNNMRQHPRGEGYAVNITLRKGDGNAEVLSGFEGVALPVMQEFKPDIVVVACGFDGLKLSPVFKHRWGEESCPGMDAEYTPSLYGYIINRVRKEVQSKVVAATEGGYDPISVGLAARSVAKGLKGVAIPKPPMRIFNSEWTSQLNNIFQLQRLFWKSLSQ